MFAAANDALPGINLPTRSQLLSFVESQPVQAALQDAAAMAPAIGAGLAPLAQPAIVLAPASAPGALPGIAANQAVLPLPLPAETAPQPQTPSTPQTQATTEQPATQAADNVIQDGPLRGAILVDADAPATDPSQIPPLLDPRYLV